MDRSAARMMGAPASPGRTDRVRSCIAALLGDPCVAERVRRRLARAEEAAARELAGTPPCWRADDAAALLPALLRGGRCRATCRSVDCLCGRYPRTLSDREIVDGRLREFVAL